MGRGQRYFRSFFLLESLPALIELGTVAHEIIINTRIVTTPNAIPKPRTVAPIASPDISPRFLWQFKQNTDSESHVSPGSITKLPHTDQRQAEVQFPGVREGSHSSPGSTTSLGHTDHMQNSVQFVGVREGSHSSPGSTTELLHTDQRQNSVQLSGVNRGSHSSMGKSTIELLH